MEVVIVAPCHVPVMIGGSEKLWWGLLEYLNDHTPHVADLVKVPGPERNFWEVVDSYRRFSELDVRPYEVIITSKYPAWMIDHDAHVCYYQHPLRGLYDTYPATLPPRCELRHPDILGLVGLLRGGDHSREALREAFQRIERLRSPRRLLRRYVPEEAFAFPGPLIREIVHFCDHVAFRPGAVRRYCAISATVARRDGYLPGDAQVTLVHHPSDLSGYRQPRPGRYLFTVSRLEHPKRIDLLIEAVRLLEEEAELWIAGTGPEEERLRQLAAGDPRVRFLGFVNDEALLDLYADALAVLFVPYEEDLGLVTLEAMAAGKPVISSSDSGGSTELIEDGVTGFIVEPKPEAIAGKADKLLADRELAREMGERGAAYAADVNWGSVCKALLGGLES